MPAATRNSTLSVQSSRGNCGFLTSNAHWGECKNLYHGLQICRDVVAKQVICYLPAGMLSKFSVYMEQARWNEKDKYDRNDMRLSAVQAYMGSS